VSDKYVKLIWRDTGKHEIELVGISRPGELRKLLEHGLKHIRRCLFQGKPLGDVSKMLRDEVTTEDNLKQEASK
jgi:hypothetical protein